MRILVLGGGKLGRAMTERLTRDRHTIRLFSRRPPDWPLPSRTESWLGDAMDRSAVEQALSSQDVLINVIGSKTMRANTVESGTTAVAVQAATAAGTSRYIGMSAGMVAPVNVIFDYVLKPLLFRNLMREHLAVERIIRASALDWTILRPSILTDAPARGYRAAPDRPPGRATSTTRADVADFVATELREGRYHNQAVFLLSR